MAAAVVAASQSFGGGTCVQRDNCVACMYSGSGGAFVSAGGGVAGVHKMVAAHGASGGRDPPSSTTCLVLPGKQQGMMPKTPYSVLEQMGQLFTQFRCAWFFAAGPGSAAEQRTLHGAGGPLPSLRHWHPPGRPSRGHRAGGTGLARVLSRPCNEQLWLAVAQRGQWNWACQYVRAKSQQGRT